MGKPPLPEFKKASSARGEGGNAALTGRRRGNVSILLAECELKTSAGRRGRCEKREPGMEGEEEKLGLRGQGRGTPRNPSSDKEHQNRRRKRRGKSFNSLGVRGTKEAKNPFRDKARGGILPISGSYGTEGGGESCRPPRSQENPGNMSMRRRRKTRCKRSATKGKRTEMEKDSSLRDTLSKRKRGKKKVRQNAERRWNPKGKLLTSPRCERSRRGEECLRRARHRIDLANKGGFELLTGALDIGESRGS